MEPNFLTWMALLPMGSFGLVSGAVALKLLLLARRTRQFPELAISLNTLLVAVVGLPMAVAGRSPAYFGSETGTVLFAAGMLFVCLGLQFVFLFTWYVFRRRDAWAIALVGIAGLAFAALWLAMVTWGLGATDLHAAQEQIKPFAIGIISLQALGAIWSGAESLLYWRKQRIRLRLGLSDPLVVERFLWWALSHFASIVLSITLIRSLVLGNLVLRDPFALLMLGLVGSVLVFTWGLSFFPPKFYVRWVEARSAAP